jgi:hypothetical protein
VSELGGGQAQFSGGRRQILAQMEWTVDLADGWKQWIVLMYRYCPTAHWKFIHVFRFGDDGLWRSFYRIKLVFYGFMMSLTIRF